MSIIAEGAEIGDNVKIFEQCYLGSNVTIGAGSIVFPGVRILDGSIVGNNCIIHSGVIIGSDGFGFAPQENGVYKKIPQTGIVVIGDNVDVGANSTIDRATLGFTSIGNGVKLDNLIQIGHNVMIGDNTVIGSNCIIYGPTAFGCENKIHPFSAIGTNPQDKKFKETDESRLVIGDRNTIREYSSINRGTEHGGGITRVGNDNLIMAYLMLDNLDLILMD